jgi:hypothetical protein
MPNSTPDNEPTRLSTARSSRDAHELAVENERLVSALGDAERARQQAEARTEMLARLVATERKKTISAETTAYQAIERADHLAGFQRRLVDASPREAMRLLREARRDRG